MTIVRTDHMCNSVFRLTEYVMFYLSIPFLAEDVGWLNETILFILSGYICINRILAEPCVYLYI
jgi:hypothetical protein